MATVEKWLEFTVHLTDKARVAELQALYPAGAKNVAPITMSTLMAAPIQETSATFAAPCSRSPYFIPGSAYPRDVAQFTRKSGGWFGLSFLFGNTTNYHWYANFAYAAGTTAEIDGTPTEVVAIAQRRNMMSFDAIGTMEEAGGLGSTAINRGASRHADGAGFSVRQESSSHEVSMSPTSGGGGASNQAWDRFYMRVNKAPTLGLARFYRVGLAGGASRGFSLDLTVDLRVQFKNIQDGGTEAGFNTTTDQLEIGRWYRFDVVWKSGAAGSNQTRVYIGRKLVMTQVVTASGGMNTASNHAASYLGSFAGWETGDQPEMDFDDWVMADWPTVDSGGRFAGKDWLNGSRVKFIPLSAMGPGNAWTGPVDHRMLNANLHNPVAADATSKFTTSTSGAALVGTVEAKEITTVPGALGAVAFYVVAFIRQTVAGAGTIGWRFNGLLDLAALASQSTGYRWERRLYRPSGLTDPIASLTPLEVHHIKAANVNPADCQALGAVVELIGTFGDEDVPADTEESDTPPALPPRRLGTHNAPYPGSPWARATAPVQSPVVVHSGTYVGNSTITELTFRSNVNWIWIRQVSAVAGQFFFSSAWAGHFEGQEAALPGIDALLDPAFVPSGVIDTQEQRCVVRLVGDSLAWNRTAITYEYVAVMDPGARLMLNGQFHHQTTVVSFANPLPVATFTPEYTFFQVENVSGSGYQRSVKGLGHAAPNGSILNLAESATIAQVAAGSITSLATLHNGNDRPTLYSAWRRDDGSGDPNRFKVVKIGSYVGDGSASRTVGFENATGLRPLFAIVTPHTALSYVRDPSNLTNTSNAMGTGTSSTTAITAGGIDSFSVGSTLNTNGVTFEYFVILGSATAGNGGWSIDGEFAYLEPDWIDPDFVEPPDFDEEPTPVDPDPDPGPDDTEDCTDPDSVCILATTRVANVALTHIGVTKLLTNYCTQNSTEAQVVRALYEDSVRKVLRDFPWPFATKYAALVLASTQPSAANEDWDFAYRMPADCIFERRLVTDREGTANPTPPPFMLSSDASGGLIFTNEADAFLCYTCRPVCVAFASDTLFREALGWHLAGALAPPLTRMTDVAKMCYEKYDEAIAKAHAVIKPGVPGLRTAADPTSPDAGAACIAANVDVANAALLRIGARPVANLSSEQSREAIAVMMIFENELRATLRDYPWRFAKRYNETLTFIAGTESVPVNADWQYSHRLPSDYVMARRLITQGTGRSYDENPKVFEISTDATGPLLFSHELDPMLEYTARIPCAVNQADPLFKDAFAWRLSAALAPSLAQVDPEMPEQHGRGPEDPPQKDMRIRSKPNKAAMRLQVAQMARRMYERVLVQARVADANEANPEHPGEAPWIAGR